MDKESSMARPQVDQALVSDEAASVSTLSDFDPSREFIEQIVDAVRDAAEGRRPQGFGFGSPHSTAVQLGLIEECSQKKPCRTCGTPRHDWTYWKATLAGQAYLALAIANEARSDATGTGAAEGESAAIARKEDHDQ